MPCNGVLKILKAMQATFLKKRTISAGNFSFNTYRAFPG
jgi:hypothetical protein